MASQHVRSALFLIAATVGIHGAGTLVVFWTLFRVRMHAARHFGFIHNTIVLTIVIVALMAVHVTEVAFWAGFYSHEKCFADFSTSLYFSLVSYTSVGYGDVVLRDPGWRLLGGLEALTASLMMCWSTVLLVQVLNKRYTHAMRPIGKRKSSSRERIHHPGPRR